MTPSIAKAIFVFLTVGWYAIRFPYARRSRRATVVRSARGLRETVLLLISLTGLGHLAPYLRRHRLSAIRELFLPGATGMDRSLDRDRVAHNVPHDA